MRKLRSKGARPRRRHLVTKGMHDALKSMVIANHAELTELRKTAEENFRRVAELQVEVDRLKKLLSGV